MIWPADLDRDGATLDPTKFLQPLDKSGHPLGLDRGSVCTQIADGGSFAVCCASAASGHAAAAPPTSAMNSHRFS
jgi:hypothetical protein